MTTSCKQKRQKCNRTETGNNFLWFQKSKHNEIRAFIYTDEGPGRRAWAGNPCSNYISNSERFICAAWSGGRAGGVREEPFQLTAA